MLVCFNLILLYLFILLYKHYQKLNYLDYFFIIIVFFINIFLFNDLTLVIINYILLLVLIVDLKEMWIPDLTHLLVGVINVLKYTIKGFFYNISFNYEGIICSILLIFCILLLQKILRKDIMGFGDLKLLMVLSIGFSFYEFWFLLLISSMLGVLGYYLFFKKQKVFPYGPFIVFGYIIVCLK